MNKNTELSAEAMAIVETICENGNMPSERDNVKRLILEILQHKHKLISMDLNDIRLFRPMGHFAWYNRCISLVNTNFTEDSNPTKYRLIGWKE